MKGKNNSGQALTEYAIVIFALATALFGFFALFCAAFDEYVQGIYFILQAPFP